MKAMIDGTGPLADRLAVVLADGAVAATIILPGAPGVDWAAWLAKTIDRATTAHRDGATVVIIVIDPATRRRAHDALTGAIGAMAIDFAPRTRVCMIDVAPGAAEDDIAAAIDYLAHAGATTGQVLQISSR